MTLYKCIHSPRKNGPVHCLRPPFVYLYDRCNCACTVLEYLVGSSGAKCTKPGTTTSSSVVVLEYEFQFLTTCGTSTTVHEYSTVVALSSTGSTEYGVPYRNADFCSSTVLTVASHFQSNAAELRNAQVREPFVLRPTPSPCTTAVGSRWR